MNICLGSIHPRAVSGQIEGTLALAQELRRLGHNVRIATWCDEDALLHRTSTSHANHDRGALFTKLFRMPLALREIVRDSRDADLVHLSLPTPAFSMIGDVIQASLNVPVVVEFESQLAPAPGTAKWRWTLKAPGFYVPLILINNPIVSRITSHGAAHYIVSSRVQKQELVRGGFDAEKISVLSNLVTWPSSRFATRDRARELLGLPEGKLVAYVGHYNHVKGVDVLVKAFSRLPRSQAGAKLVLAWSGQGDPAPIEAAIKRNGIAAKVIHLGMVDVGVLMKAADVVVLPYRMTAGQAVFPSLVLASLAAEVPLITSDLPIIREIVTDGVHAQLSRPESARDVRDQLARALTDTDFARSLARAGREMAEARFSSEVLGQRYEEIYEQVRTDYAAVLQRSNRSANLRFSALRGRGRSVGRFEGAVNRP